MASNDLVEQLIRRSGLVPPDPSRVLAGKLGSLTRLPREAWVRGMPPRTISVPLGGGLTLHLAPPPTHQQKERRRSRPQVRQQDRHPRR